MRKSRWLWVAALAWLGGIGCANPELSQKVHKSMVTVQTFYDPLIQQELGQNKKVQQAIVAADTTLLLASELQRQWSPNPDQAKQLELQAQEAKKLAQEAGVAEAGASRDQASLPGIQ
jgi:hypothetical protein